MSKGGRISAYSKTYKPVHRALLSAEFSLFNTEAVCGIEVLPLGCLLPEVHSLANNQKRNVVFYVLSQFA